MQDDAFLDTLLGRGADRLRGVSRWDQLPGLGRGNLARIIALLRAESGLALAEDRTRDELRELAQATARVTALHDASDLHRPILPRLRNELFRAGDAVLVYVGDSPSVTTDAAWVHGRIAIVEKAYRPDWDNGEPNGGYFWRSTIATDAPVFADGQPLRCSTTEPRVLLAADGPALVALAREAPDFVAIFAANAWRPFTPLWCLERALPFQPEAVEVQRWLDALSTLP